jgi:radical SAM superfamily enzyme YgiQ (UPF0313 family)
MKIKMKILLIAYDNQSYISPFPTGLAYIASALRKDHEVEIYNQDVHHYPDEHLTWYLDNNKFDVVGVGVVGGYYQYKKLLGIASAINRSTQRPHFIIGGHGPSPDADYFKQKTSCDAVVVGEGEKAVKYALEGFGSFKEELIADVDSIPFPAYDLFPIEVYRLMREAHCENTDFVMPMISGRGCPFKCTFCYRMDEGFRPRSAESIIEEIKLLQRHYRINYIIFNDELLMSSVRRTSELCDAFLKEGLKFKWFCNGRLNFANDGLLKLMKKAGCVCINYGIEAMDDIVLRKMNKQLTVEQIYKGIETTLEAGISPGLNMMFGNIGDNKEVLTKDVEFLLKYDNGAHRRTIRPVTPYPGSALYYHAIERGLLYGCADFYENKHLNSDLLSVNFTDMDDDEFHLALLDANERLLRSYYQKQMEGVIKEAQDLYIKKNTGFRGFRTT